MSRFQRSRTGIVLLMVLGVLAIMSVLAMTFVSLSRLERSIARNYVSTVRSQMLTESGIEHAIIGVQRLQGGVLTPEEVEQTLYYPSATCEYGDPSSWAPDLQAAETPSFDLSNGTVGDGISYSIATEGEQHDYRLKIVDESGKFNVNDEPGVGVSLRVYNILRDLAACVFEDPLLGVLVAERICTARDAAGGRFVDMNALSSALTDSGLLSDMQWLVLAEHLTLYSWIDTSVLIPSLSINEVANPGPQPPSQLDEVDLKPMIGMAGGPIEIKELPSDQPLVLVSDNALERVPFDVDYRLTPDLVYSWMDWQVAHFRTGTRAPVNLNTCKPSMIRALLAPVQGIYLEELPETWSRRSFRCTGGPAEWAYGLTHTDGMYYPTRFNYYDIDSQRVIPTASSVDPIYPVERPIETHSCFGRIRVTESLGNPLEPSSIVSQLADKLWKRIHVGEDTDGDGNPDGPPQPFTQWQEFGDYVRSLAYDPSVDSPSVAAIEGFDSYMADAVISNCNPNSGLSDYNPDSLVYRSVDKARLIAYTTEFCLEPTGVFSIESIGRVRADNQLIGEGRIRCTVKAYDIIRLSTQKQFLAGYEDSTPDPHDLYFEGVEETRNGSVSESDGLFATAGADFTSTGNVSGRWGYSLMTYPEPITVAPNLSDPTSPVYNPPAWHGPGAAQNPGNHSGADTGWTPDKGYSDNDWNYIDESVYDGYIGLATYSQEKADAGLNLVSMANFEKTLRPLLVNAGATKDMFKGYDPITRSPEVVDVNPNYPAKTFTSSPKVIYFWLGTHWGYPGLGDLLAVILNYGQPFVSLVCQDPTPQNFPTIDRLTYGWPKDPVEPSERRIPGVLHPDGALSDLGRSISFDARNIGQNSGTNQGTTGTIHFWIKPNFDPGRGSRVRTLLSLDQPHIGNHNTMAGTVPLQRAKNENIWELTMFPRTGGFQDPGTPGVGHFADESMSTPLTFNTDMVGDQWGPAACMQWGMYYFRPAPNQIQVTMAMALSGSVNHSHESATGLQTPGSDGFYNFEFHKWNHIGVGWSPSPNDTNNVGAIINGQQIKYKEEWNQGKWGTHLNLRHDPHNGYWPPDPDTLPPATFYPTPPRTYNSFGDVYWLPTNFVEPGNGCPKPPFTATEQAPLVEWIRDANGGGDAGDIAARLRTDPNFYVRLGSPGGAGQRNYPADSTYDEIFCYSNMLTDPTSGSSAFKNFNKQFYQRGRYFGGSMVNEDAGFYTSAPIYPYRELAVAGDETLRPRSISVTCYWPYRNGYRMESGNRSAASADGFLDLSSTPVNSGDRPNEWLPNENWDPIVMDIYTSKNNWVFGRDDTSFYDYASEMATCASGSKLPETSPVTGQRVRLERRDNDEFRFRLYFNIAPGVAVYETPIVDDVTITFERSRPVVLHYQIG